MKEIAKQILEIIKKHPDYDSERVKIELLDMVDEETIEELFKFYEEIQKNEYEPGDTNEQNSLIAYLLGLTIKKPTKEYCHKERRIYARPGWPDVDFDICTERRHEIEEYVIEKYGRDKVANIGTIGTFQVAASVRRAIQVLDPEHTYTQENDWGEKIRKTKGTDPNNDLRNTIGETLPTVMKEADGTAIKSVDQACKQYPAFKEYMDKYPNVYKVAKRLYETGVIQNYGRHAAAWILSPFPMADMCPLHVTKRNKNCPNDIATQYSMGEVESLGLIKMDFLGVATETVIARTLKLIKDRYNLDLDIEKLPRDDKKTLELFSSGNTIGVFQCESPGMQDTLKLIGVDSIQDVIVAIAMYRPGPLQYIPDYANRKHGRQEVEYAHPIMEKISKSTQAILVFQEQSMSVFVEMAGLSEIDGHQFVKACSKKKKDVVEKLLQKFIKGCIKNGISKSIAIKVAKDLEKFAGYGFNMAHSVGYGTNESFLCCYLKAHFPTEFMASQLSVEYRRKTERLMKTYKQEVRRMGYKILPVDINKSGMDWQIVDEKTLREPLIVKGVGLKSAQEIVDNQPYREDDLIYSLIRKTHRSIKKNATNVDKDAIGWLWEAGAFPGISKDSLLQKYDAIVHDIRIGRSHGGKDLFKNN